jgi:acyl-coenzyme A thioesterase PaaI-like protein
MKKTWLLRLINFWPPYLGSGVKVIHISPDVRSIEVRMDLKFWNRNYVGVHFGGSLYAMTDPFFMLMMMENLGSEYIVWDKAAAIRFRKPGKGRVYAKFSLAQEDIDSVKAAADNGPKAEPIFTVCVLDGAGDVVAEVEKTLYVRRKDRKKQE